MRPPRLMITDQFAGYATPGRQQPTKKAGQLQHPLPPRAVWQLLDHAKPELEAASSPKRVAGDLSRACDSRHYGGGWMGIIPIGHPPWTMLADSRPHKHTDLSYAEASWYQRPSRFSSRPARRWRCSAIPRWFGRTVSPNSRER